MGRELPHHGLARPDRSAWMTGIPQSLVPEFEFLTGGRSPHTIRSFPVSIAS